jgi:uncharacterized RDD family membrane protein YckC
MEKENKVVYLTDYIETNQKIKTVSKRMDLTEPQSHLFKRIISFGVDILAISLLKISLHGAYAVFINQFFSPLNAQQRAELINGNILLHAVIFVAIYTAYFLYTSFVLDGKTLGKMTMGLRVVDEGFIQDADQMTYNISLQNSFRRSMGYLLCYLSFGTFFVFNFSSEDKRGLPDYLSSSRTVSDDWLANMLEHKQYSAETINIDIQSLEVLKAS